MNFKTVSFGLLMSLLMLNGGESNECNYHQTENTNNEKTYYVYYPKCPNEAKGEPHCIWELKSLHTIKINCFIDIPPSNNCIENSISIQLDGSEPHKYCGKGEIIKSGNNVNIKFDAQYESKFSCQITTISGDNSQYCSCGWKNPTKIVGGNETGVNEYPMMAGIVNLVTKKIYCGATIIDNEYVLTAAHCIEKKNITDIIVVVGEHDVTTGSETDATKLYHIKGCKIHPNYNFTSYSHDIAVCKIDGNIKYSNKVGPVCLPFQHHCDSFGGADVTLLGWGLMGFGDKKSDVLHGVDVNVITTRDCKRYYYDSDLRYIMCTYTPNKDACQMDSGGPLLWHNPKTNNTVLVGIISSGSGCASEEPALNTHVGRHIDWIKRVTGVDFCEVE